MFYRIESALLFIDRPINRLDLVRNENGCEKYCPRFRFSGNEESIKPEAESL